MIRSLITTVLGTSLLHTVAATLAQRAPLDHRSNK
jgi:hypothetical protein